MWKCADPELEWQIRCFPYGEHSDVPRLQQVEQKAVRRQRNLGLESNLSITNTKAGCKEVRFKTLLPTPCKDCFFVVFKSKFVIPCTITQDLS